MADIFNTPDIQAAQNNVNTTSRAATEAAAQGQTLPDRLQAALNKSFSTDNPLVQTRQSDLQNYLNESTAAPISVLPENNNGVVFSPLQQSNIINMRKSAALAPLTTDNYLLGLNQGGIQNVIDATGRAYGADTTRLQGAAALAQQNLATLIDQAKTNAQLNAPQTQIIDVGGKKLLVNSLTGETIKDLGSSSTGSGTSSDMSTLLATLGFGGGLSGASSVEAKPAKDVQSYTNYVVAQQKNPGSVYLSPGGQWAWNPNINDWSPVSN